MNIIAIVILIASTFFLLGEFFKSKLDKTSADAEYGVAPWFWRSMFLLSLLYLFVK